MIVLGFILKDLFLACLLVFFCCLQEKLKKILGTRKFRNLKEKYNFEVRDSRVIMFNNSLRS